MPIDDERREIAARLREMNDYEIPVEIVRTCLGLKTGEVMYKEERRRLSDRIADLIEPSCDRDELIELADELEEKAQFARASTKHAVIYVGYAREYESLARRIREACGEVER